MRGFLDGLSLQHRIALSVALGLGAILFLFGYLATSAVQQSKDLVFQERLALAKTMAGHIDYLLGRTLGQLEEMVGQSPVTWGNASLEDKRRLLSDVYYRLGVFTTVELLDSRGAVVWAEPYLPEAQGTQAFGLANAQVALSGNRPTVLQLAIPSAGSAPMVAMTVPLWNRGELVGGVVGRLNLARAGLDVVPAPNLGPTGRSEIIDRMGWLIASSHEGGASGFVNHIAVLNPFLAAGQAGVTIHRMPQGAEQPDHIVAYAPMANLPWGIVVEQDEDVALALPEGLQRKMLLAGFLALLVVAGAVWLDLRRVVEPLRGLTEASQRIAGGDLNTPVAVRPIGEVGALAQSFESMRARLRVSLEQIKGWNEELEKRVEERTRELERRHRELAAVNSVAETVNRSLNLDQVLKGALGQVLAITEADAGSISLREENGRLSRRVHQSSIGGLPELACGEVEECLCGRVACSGEPLVCNSPGEVGEGVEAACLKNGYPSLAILPLKSKDRVLGVLFLASARPGNFASQEPKVLEAVTHQISVAVENARLYGEIQRREELRGQLLAKVISVQEEERKRIARELHDESAQALTALIMSLKAIEDALPPELERERERTARTKEQAVKALMEMRQLILDLRPSTLDDLGLVPAIRWYAETHLQPLGIQFSVVASGTKGRLSPQLETTIFRIAQEAINNIARHSRAGRAWIRLEASPDSVCCQVEDDGQGFDVEALTSGKDGARGLGLLGMQERVSLFGGAFTLRSRPGQGTSVRIEIPVRGA